MALSWDSTVSVWDIRHKIKILINSKGCTRITCPLAACPSLQNTTQHPGVRLLQVIHVLSEAEGSLLCHGLSPSIFRPESQSRPPSLQDKQPPSFSKRRRHWPEKTRRLSLVLTWYSCVCRSCRPSCLCCVCLCLRSATIQDETVRHQASVVRFKFYMLLFVVTYLTVSV